MATDIRMTIMLITIISSMRVKPPCRARAVIAFTGNTLPCLVLRPVQGCAFRFGIYVEDILPAPGVRVWIILHRTQPPLGLAGHRVHGNAAQKAKLLAIGVHTFYQGLEVRRVALTVDLDLKGSPIGSVFIAVDGVPHLP